VLVSKAYARLVPVRLSVLVYEHHGFLRTERETFSLAFLEDRNG